MSFALAHQGFHVEHSLVILFWFLNHMIMVTVAHKHMGNESGWRCLMLADHMLR